jgi:hypothetical protein
MFTNHRINKITIEWISVKIIYMNFKTIEVMTSEVGQKCPTHSRFLPFDLTDKTVTKKSCFDYIPVTSSANNWNKISLKTILI